MRKVSLEMNLGKKSKARFPRRIQSNLKIKIIAPAAAAEPLPPLGPALTLFGVNARAFCEDFNHYSKDYDVNFPVSLNLWITQTKSYYYEFRTPSCFNLFHHCFNFYEGNQLYLSKNLVLLSSINISLIKTTDNFFKNKFLSTVKEILGSLRSYGFRQKKIKTQIVKLKYYTRNNHLYSSKFNLKKNANIPTIYKKS